MADGRTSVSEQGFDVATAVENMQDAYARWSPYFENVEAGSVGEAIGHQDNLRSCKARPSRLRSSAN